MFRFVSFSLLVAMVVSSTTAGELNLSARQVTLAGHFESYQLVVSDGTGPSATDLTRVVSYRSSDPAVAAVSATGRIHAVRNGRTNIVVTGPGTDAQVEVVVSGMDSAPAPGFLRDVMPILSRAGCNMGPCHASQYGKGGFKLSVFGYDPAADHAAMVRDRQQRRINPLNAEDSLLLLKPTLQVPHGGSRRIRTGSPEYAVLRAWIAAGAPGPDSSEPAVTSIEVAPPHRTGHPDDVQQLRVEARYSDGTQRDVTAWAQFDSMDDGVVEVDRDGWARIVGRGQAQVMVRFQGHAQIATFVSPYADSVQLTGWKDRNFVDELARARFVELGIEPSPLCDDATFLRRACLDAIGTHPSVEETTAFLSSTDPQKRERLVDRLLGLTGDPALDTYNDAYAAWWTLKWSDLIRNDSKEIGEQGMWALHNWIRESFRTNKPWDQFVRELVTARGSIYQNGPANFFRINRTSSDLAEATSQLFLGVRLQCARCHHHPFEKYSQEDYYGFAACFARVGTKNSQEFGLFGRESVVVVGSTGDVRHNGRVLAPTPPGGEPLEHPIDRRIPLADWLTSPQNDLFAKAVVNRYVSYLLGRGLVEPVDDLRATNPPSNDRLMDALAAKFVEDGFDLKQLLRTIMTSRLYQLDSQPLPQNQSDRRFFSYYKVKRLSAEALLDAVDRATGVPTKFRSLPSGTRAIELPDAEYPNYFLTTFAKPRRASVCECERSPDENLAQALHTLNGDTLMTRISDKNGRLAGLLAAKTDRTEIIRQLYLATLCRPPTDEETVVWGEFLDAAKTPREGYEDLFWTLLNSKQFLFVR